MVYINLGSIAVLTPRKMLAVAWVQGNNEKALLWIIRSDGGVSSIFPPEFLAETKDRGKLASWCPQDQILKHPAIGVFDNLTLERVSCRVSFICLPFFS